MSIVVISRRKTIVDNKIPEMGELLAIKSGHELKLGQHQIRYRGEWDQARKISKLKTIENQNSWVLNGPLYNIPI